MKLTASTHSALWVAGTHASTIVLRLISSVILTRLLFPEAFGQVLIIASITTLIHLVSEVGFRGSIINNPRGESDYSYVNTIWTLMIIRSLLVSSILLAISFYIDNIYPEQPELAFLIRIAALTSIIRGFSSTKIFQHEKRMEMGRIGIIQIGSRITALIATIFIIQFEASAAAILLGELVATLVVVSLSHFWLKGTPNMLTINLDAMTVIFNYGRWILVATLISWSVGEGLKLTMSLVLSAGILGFYALASNISSIASGFINTFSEKWIFPMYTKLGQDEGMELKALKIRLIILFAASATIITLGSTAQILVDFLYDARYSDTALLIKVICIGTMGLVVTDCYVPIFKSRADSFGLMKTRTMQLVMLAIASSVGFYLNDAAGLIIGSAAGQIFGGVTSAWIASKHFSKKKYLMDSIAISLTFLIWLYFERSILEPIF